MRAVQLQIILTLTKTLHPPSGAVALVVMMTKPDWKFGSPEFMVIFLYN